MTRPARNLLTMTVVLTAVATGVFLVARRNTAGVREDSPAPPAAAAAAAPATNTAAPTAPPSSASVTGRLLDAETGAAIVDAQLSYENGGRRLVITGSDGAFTIRDLPVGEQLRIIVEAREYLQDVIAVTTRWTAPHQDLGTVKLVKGDWQGRFAGKPRGFVGIDNNLRDGKVIITRVRPNTPAAKVGLRAGERLVSVDGKAIDSFGLAARTYYLQGEAGTQVSLLVEGDGGARRTVELVRETVPGREYQMPRFN